MDSKMNHGFYHHIDDKDQLIVTTCISVQTTEQEMLKALAVYQDTIQNKAEYVHYNEVLIFPEATDMELSLSGVRQLARLAIKSDSNDPDRKLAILMQSNLGYALAKLYQFYRHLIKRSGKKARVYKNVKAALAWAKKADSAIGQGQP